LEIGVDDYMVKPFHLRELLLRVQRILQRAEWYADRPQERHGLVIGPYQVNLANLTGTGPRGALQLTALEASLLGTLTGEPNRIFTRAELLEKVWGYHGEVETRTVDNFVLRLRRYFEEEPDQPKRFVSVRSRGYMYVP
jgi:DNA-binding response OmpR family regulator